jgi:pimeloyl-ACP methyl ester carboxylesterase
MFSVLMLTLAAAVPVWAAGTVEEVTYYSNAMGGDMVALVYLPEGYQASNDEYPVVFLNGGFGAGYGNWLSTQGTIDEIDAMIGNGLVRPFIFVEIDQLTTPWPQVPVPVPSFLVDSELNGPYETTLIEDLVPWVDATYRTLGSREHRYIFGRSAGGFSTMRIAMRHWDVFGGIGTQVGAIATEVIPGAIPLILEDYPDGPPYDFTPMAGTWSMYLFSWCAALTPNLANPPWYVDLIIDEDGTLDPDVWQRFSSNNATRWATEMAGSGGTIDIFMGAGDQDFYLPFTLVFADILDGLELPYTLQMFHGDHYNPPPSIRFKSHITYFFPLNATVELKPRVLNGRHWWPLVEATIELPGDLDVADIDTSTLAITQVNGEDLDTPMQPLLATDISDVNGNGRDDLTIWFWKPTVLHVLDGLGITNGEEFDLTIEGETTDLLFLAATDEARAVNLKAARAMPTGPFWPVAID